MNHTFILGRMKIQLKTLMLKIKEASVAAVQANIIEHEVKLFDIIWVREKQLASYGISETLYRSHGDLNTH